MIDKMFLALSLAQFAFGIGPNTYLDDLGPQTYGLDGGEPLYFKGEAQGLSAPFGDRILLLPRENGLVCGVMGYTLPMDDIGLLQTMFSSISNEISTAAGSDPSKSNLGLNPADSNFVSKLWEGGRYQQVWKTEDVSVVLAIVPHLFPDRPEAIKAESLSLALGFTDLDPKCLQSASYRVPSGK